MLYTYERLMTSPVGLPWRHCLIRARDVVKRGKDEYAAAMIVICPEGRPEIVPFISYKVARTGGMKPSQKPEIERYRS